MIATLPLAVLGITWQVLVDAIGLGAVYALMAVGIGLVFGVLRLVNFAYGQLIMAGAYALAFASQWDWPLWAAIIFCFAVVIALSMAMDRAVFRPLRTQSPAVMLVATFAVAFLLQSVALLAFGPLGKPASSLGYLNRPVTIGSVDIRKITILAIVVAAVCLVAVVLLLERTRVGLHMRAAAMDFRTARLLGVRANRVIGSAVLVSALLAAAVSVILTVQNPLVTPDFALRDTIIVLAGVVVGGMNRLLSATLGGFAIGFVSGLARRRAPDRPEPVPAVVRLRPRHPRSADPPRGAVREGRHPGGAGMRSRSAVQLGGPVILVVLAALLGSFASTGDGDLLRQRARVGDDRRRALRVRRQLGRRLVRPHQLCRRRRVGGGGALRAGRGEAGDHAVPVPVPARPHGGQRPVAVDRRGSGRDLRAARRPAADAALRARCRHRDLRRARDHAQPPALLREDRPRLEHVLVRARDDRSAPGGDRCRDRDLRRLRLPVEPLRPPSPRDPRGSRGSACGRSLGVPPAAHRLHALGPAGRLCRWSLRPPAAAQHRDDVPRSHLHHAGDARDRRDDEPLGCRRRSARGERPRLAAGRGGERPRRRWRLDRSPVRHTDRGRRGAHGARLDPQAQRARPAAGSCRSTGGAVVVRYPKENRHRENLHRRLRSGRLAVRGEPRHPRRRRGVGVRPLPGARRRDQPRRVAALRRRRRPRAPAGDERSRPHCRRATSGSSRRRRCTPTRPSPQRRMRSPTALSHPS